MKNIILIGMPGCGKSTVGVILAKTIGVGFVDTDLIIQQQQQELLQKIINNFGLEYFLQVEEKALLSINYDNMVIATGGSAIFSEEGMKHLKENSVVIYLQLSCEEIKKRIENITTRGIAAKQGKTIEDIYNDRKAYYEKYADIIINAEKLTVEATVEKILKHI